MLRSLTFLTSLAIPLVLFLVGACGSEDTASPPLAGLDGSASSEGDAGSSSSDADDAKAQDSGSDGSSRQDASAGAIRWARQFGTAANDYAQAVAQDANGNLFVTGEVGAALPGQTYAGGSDAFLRKYDAAGNELWTRQFGSTKDDFSSAVKLDSTGNVIIAGYTRDVLPGQTSAGSNDAFVRKYDGAGNVLWTRQFGSTSFDSATALALDGADNIFVVGAVNAALAGQTPAGDNDVFVRKYDSAGGELWTRQFGSTGGDVPIDAAVDSNGNVIVAGYVTGALPGQSYAGNNDAFVRKYDNAGNVLWTNQFGTAASDLVQVTAVDSAGNILLAGFTNGALPGQTSKGNQDAFARKYDSAGNQTWTKQVGTTNDDRGTALFSDATGNVWVGGATVASSSVQDRAFLRQLDSAGTEVSTKEITPLSSQTRPTLVDSSGNAILIGFVNGTYPGQSGLGQNDALIINAKF